MTDFSAVIMHQNEPILARAVAAVERQTLAPHETLLANPEVRPFNRTLNEVASRVTTPYFIQVDSDMIPDPDCFERLRGAVEQPEGLVIGLLRDPLLGRIHAIKLFRTADFESGGMPDSISPDTDFQSRLNSNGQACVYVVKPHGDTPALWHTFGVHDPGYTEAYAFGRFFIQGGRYVYRSNPHGLRNLTRRLTGSTHESALAAQVGLALGVFSGKRDGVLQPYVDNPAFPRLARFFARNGSPSSGPTPAVDERDEPMDLFVRFHERGLHIRDCGNPAVLLADREVLTRSRRVEEWFALLGLYRGLMAENGDEGRARADAEYLQSLFDALPPSRRE